MGKDYIPKTVAPLKYGRRVAGYPRSTGSKSRGGAKRRQKVYYVRDKYGGITQYVKDYVVSPVMTGAKVLAYPAYPLYRAGKWVAKTAYEHPVATAAILGAALGAHGYARGYYTPTDFIPTSPLTVGLNWAVGGNKGHEFLSRSATALKEGKDSLSSAIDAVSHMGEAARHGFHAAKEVYNLSPVRAGHRVFGAARSSYRSAKSLGRSIEAGGAAIGNLTRLGLEAWTALGIKPTVAPVAASKSVEQGARHMRGVTPYKGVFEPLSPSTRASARYWKSIKAPVITPKGDLLVPNTAKWRDFARNNIMDYAGAVAGAALTGGALLLKLSQLRHSGLGNLSSLSKSFV